MHTQEEHKVHLRRFDDDNIKLEIQQLIINEQDPKEKVRLLMLMQLNATLLDNVAAVSGLTKEFKEHRIEFEEHIDAENRQIAHRKGAMWVGIFFLSIAQATFAYMFTRHMDNFDAVQRSVVELKVSDQSHVTRLNEIETKFTKLLEKLDKSK